MRRFLILSSLLHFLLASLLLARWRSAVPAEEIAPLALMVELPEPFVDPAPAPTSAPASPGQRGSQKVGARPAKPRFSFSQLAPAHTYNLLAPRPGEIPAANAEPDPFSAYAAGEDAFAAGDQAGAGALGWVYRKAHYSLGYPGEFIRHEITGRVQARLAFSQDGKFLPASLRVRADSPYLRVYVHRLLERTFLDDPVPATLVRWVGKLDVFCFVEFSFVENQAQVTAAASLPILGHKLFFARQSVKSVVEKLKWQVGPVHGLLPVPAVGVDVLWFAEQAKQLAHPRAPVDDLAPYRADPLFYN